MAAFLRWHLGSVDQIGAGEDRSFSPTGMFHILVLSPRTGTRCPEREGRRIKPKEAREPQFGAEKPHQAPTKGQGLTLITCLSSPLTFHCLPPLMLRAEAEPRAFYSIQNTFIARRNRGTTCSESRMGPPLRNEGKIDTGYECDREKIPLLQKPCRSKAQSILTVALGPHPQRPSLGRHPLEITKADPDPLSLLSRESHAAPLEGTLKAPGSLRGPLNFWAHPC